MTTIFNIVNYLSNLHSTMFLLILPCRSGHIPDNHHLHSTMFLLILSGSWTYCRFFPFTFHNVSINTGFWPSSSRLRFNLHSTMFLLILRTSIQNRLCWIRFTFHNVSINTSSAWIERGYLDGFTFHNVSINTNGFENVRTDNLNLHSTMFLLIPGECFQSSTYWAIYIPQCFY